MVDVGNGVGYLKLIASSVCGEPVALRFKALGKGEEEASGSKGGSSGPGAGRLTPATRDSSTGNFGGEEFIVTRKGIMSVSQVGMTER